VTWINVDGVNRPGLLEAFGKALNLHPLTLEDVLTTEQRPKVEDYGNYLFIVLKMLELDPETDALGIEQLSLILGPNYVLHSRSVLETCSIRCVTASEKALEKFAN
jgi:magnesium transporter